MNIYNNDGRSSNRGRSTCSYCGNPEHNATNCPRVAEDYAWFTQSPPVIPIGVSATGIIANVLVWGQIVPDQNPDWIPVVDAQTSTWTQVNNGNTVMWVEILN